MKMTEKLAFLRREKGLSQLELAERLGVTRQAVSRWETGTAAPTVENLRILSALYGISLDDLLDDGKQIQGGPGPVLEDDPVPSTIKDEEGSRRKRGKWGIAAGCFLAVITAIIIFIVVGNREASVPINDMPREEVEIVPGTEFDFDDWEVNE